MHSLSAATLLCHSFSPASAPQPFPASQGDEGYEHTAAITMTFPQAQGARNAEERQ